MAFSLSPTTRVLSGGIPWTFTLDAPDDVIDKGIAWSLDPADFGKLDRADRTCAVTAPKEPRYGTATLTARSADGKQSATAKLAYWFGLGGMWEGPELVDKVATPNAPVDIIPWGKDEAGRRSALLIMEALAQLPAEFVRAAGSVKIVRLQIREKDVRGQHLALPTGVIAIDEDIVQETAKRAAALRKAVAGGLKVDPNTATGADDVIYRVLIHELGHAVMFGKAYSSVSRWLDVLRPYITWGLTPTTLGLSHLIVPGAYWLSSYNPWMAPDFASEYAKVSGWEINNWNPFRGLWDQTPVRPNVITGLLKDDPIVGLKNPTRPPPKSPDTAYQAAGFPRAYAATTLHEDFADLFAELATNPPWKDNPNVKARLAFIRKHKLWPATWEKIGPGGILHAWARKNRKPLPDLSAWGVGLGIYVHSEPPKPPRRKTGTVKAASVAATGWDDGHWMVDPIGGGEQTWDHPEELEEEYAGRAAFAKAAPVMQQQAEQLGPTLATLQEATAGLPAPPLSGDGADDPFGALRVAAAHGDGLQVVRSAEVRKEGLAVPGLRPQPGDLLFDASRARWIVGAVDPLGWITQIVGEPVAGRDEAPRPPKLDPRRLRFLWHPTAAARWRSRGPLDLAAVVGLWGRRTGAAGRYLDWQDEFLVEVYTLAGRSIRGLRGSDGDELAARLDEDLRPVEAPAEGDVVRLTRTKAFGVVVGTGGETVDVLVEGAADKGVMGEDDDATKLLVDLPLARVQRAWRWP